MSDHRPIWARFRIDRAGDDVPPLTAPMGYRPCSSAVVICSRAGTSLPSFTCATNAGLE